MKQMLVSSDRFDYGLKMFFRNNPSEDFVQINFDNSPRGKLCKERYGTEVVHRSGRYTFDKIKSIEAMQIELENSLTRTWYGNMHDLKE